MKPKLERGSIPLVALAVVVFVVAGASVAVYVGRDDVPRSPAPEERDSGAILEDLERQISMAVKSGGIHPDAKAFVTGEIYALEARGADPERIAALRAALAKVPVGGTQRPKATSTPPARTPPQAARTVSANAPAQVAKHKIYPGVVGWTYATAKWEPEETPPACPPLIFESPVDITKASSILYPGQIRGSSIKDYKAHGGFRFDKLGSQDMEVRLPFDAILWDGGASQQEGHPQYGLNFLHECGLMMRFGHLFELSPKLQEIAKNFSALPGNDARVEKKLYRMKKGELLATKIGIPGNVGMDWGVYDLRRQNESTKDPVFRDAHYFQRSWDYYGLCWLDLLPKEQAAVAKALPGGDGTSGTTSDYCNRAPAPALGGDLILHNIGVELGEWDAANKRMGDFVFTSAIGEHFSKKAFLEFGAWLTGPSGTDVMPHPTYFLPLGTEVFSPVSGTIEAIRDQGADYEVVIAPEGYPGWRLSFDHIIALKVKKGDSVGVAQDIGEVGPPNSGAVPAGFGWVELQVWKTATMKGVCPFKLFGAAMRGEIGARITQLAKEWEALLGQDVYKQEQWVYPGCLADEVDA